MLERRHQELQSVVQDETHALAMAVFLDERGLVPTRFFGGGEINTSLVVRDISGKQSVVTFGPPVHPSLMNLKSVVDAGYMDVGKFEKAMVVSNHLGLQGLPVVRFNGAGRLMVGESICAWGIQNLAVGIPLSSTWTEMSHDDKLRLSRSIGQFMAEVHSQEQVITSQFQSSAGEWYKHRIRALTSDGIDHQMLATKEAEEIEKAVNLLLSQANPRDIMGLIHGDLFQPNIFFDPDQENMPITSVIDWETSIIGHTGYDQILTAWWLSGEHDGNRMVFDTIMDESSKSVQGGGFDSMTPPRGNNFSRSFVAHKRYCFMLINAKN